MKLILSLALILVTGQLVQAADGDPGSKLGVGIQSNANATGSSCPDGTCQPHTQKNCERDMTTANGCADNVGNAKTGKGPSTDDSTATAAGASH